MGSPGYCMSFFMMNFHLTSQVPDQNDKVYNDKTLNKIYKLKMF